ncbi:MULTISPECIES: hypothetical protein [Bacteroides]|uniref:hypothetical protein n=1 Tax=unclassified Bacteroides TaxID=2646097 RepID=UPI00168A68ED|nr:MULTISPECIES: hypothetical protein [unclassified Bacteroides]MBD3587793.1 hypothetical protein [Bacteroides sp. GM023]
METEKKIEDNMRSALKQALERRQMERLSSNFSYRMMGHIRLEAEKQRKRKAKISWVALLTSVFALLGLGIYFLFFYVDINFADYLPQTDVRSEAPLLKFYIYIALLVLILLGVDYWLRKKYIWK